jgi:hypothetical protein
MSNALDDLFDARVPSVPYALTFTDMSPTSHQPTVSFATGVLTFVERKVGLGGPHGSGGPFIILDQHYVDESLAFWLGEGSRFKPPSMTPGTWPNRLLLRPVASGGYYFEYMDKAHPASSSGPFYLEITTGSGFPGFPQLRTAVSVARYWTGIAALVIGLPDVEK